MGFYNEPLISLQMENVFYNDDKLTISVKLYSMYNIYCNKSVAINLIIEDNIANKVYEYAGRVKNDILYVDISKNELRDLKENNMETLVKVKVFNTNGNIIAIETVKGRIWEENEFSAELNYNDDTLKLLITNKNDNINIFIIKEILINEIDEIQRYYSNLKVLFKSNKSISNIIDENSKINLVVSKKNYTSHDIEIINENYFYVYYKVENQDDIIEKILIDDVFLISIIEGKRYKNKIDKINKTKIYKSTYQVLRLKVKNYFSK